MILIPRDLASVQIDNNNKTNRDILESWPKLPERDTYKHITCGKMNQGNKDCIGHGEVNNAVVFLLLLFQC